MPLVLLIQLVGRLLAILPERAVERFTAAAGWLLYHAPFKRCREMKSNLHHAFPEKSPSWRRRVGRATSARLLEMTFFALTSPYRSRKWFARHLEWGEGAEEAMREAMCGGQGSLALIPHVTLAEMVSALPVVLPEAEGHPAVYRPLKQPAVDRFVRMTRGRWGVELLSRHEGIGAMMRSVREGKCLGLLFDQNAGKRGQLFFFLDRVASGTHLPGLVARKLGARPYFLVPRRVGFWKAVLECQRLPMPDRPADLLLSSHGQLEAYLKGGEMQAADWLWFHNRWGTHDHPRKRFFLRETDNMLQGSLDTQGKRRWPRRTRLWFRLPNWLGDVIMAVPLLRAVRRGRPDAEITLVAQPGLRPLLETLDLADHIIDTPSHKSFGISYFKHFFTLRKSYPDCWLSLTNSFRGDAEAWLTGSPVRLGMVRPGKFRPLLTAPWRVPTDIDETQCHQLEVWERFFRYHGLREPLDVTPKVRPLGEAGEGIGLICGTENTPAKRWPVARWQALVGRFLEETGQTLYLYGTPRDREIAEEVVSAVPKVTEGRVQNLAGETNLQEFADHLARRKVVICNDTGGMHLANLLGVPVIAIFGPTNPQRTGPVFEAPRWVLQPAGCAPTGGGAIEEVTVDQVWRAWEELHD